MLQAAHIGLDGHGLCDSNSVAGVVRAHLIKREQKLTLAYHPGARLVFADGTPDILAYPRDRGAWGRLCRLLTRGNLRAKKGECILYLDDLLEHIEGLELIVMERSTWELPSPPFLRSSRLNRQSLGCHAPLQAGYPVIPTRRVAAKPRPPRTSPVSGSSPWADAGGREAGVPRFCLFAPRQ